MKNVNFRQAVQQRLVIGNGLLFHMTQPMITIRFAGWISGRIVSLQQDKDFQKLLSNGNRIRNRISETILSIFRGFGL